MSTDGRLAESEPIVYQACPVKYFHYLQEVTMEPANALWRPYCKTHSAMDSIQQPNAIVHIIVSKQQEALDANQFYRICHVSFPCFKLLLVFPRYRASRRVTILR